MGEYRPSPLVRWPLHLLNALLLITILALAAVAVLLQRLGEDPPWVLVWTGGGICLFFLLLNFAVASLRLWVDEGGARLRIWPWRRRIPWRGAEVLKIVRPVGVTGVRIIDDRGRRIWISQAWFSDFEAALAEIEQATAAAGVEIREVEE